MNSESDLPAASDTEELERLRAESAELRTELDKEKSGKRRRPTGRGIGSIVVMVVATLLLPIALLAYWGQRTLLDTNQYISTVAPLSEDPTVQLALGDAISKQLKNNFDLQGEIAQLLPDRAKPLAGPIASGVSSFIDGQIANFLASDRFSTLWVNINTKAQEALVRALEGDQSGAISVQGSNVVLDTGTLIDQIKQRLIDRGLTVVEKIPVPAAADRQIVLLDAPQLQQIQNIYKLTNPIAKWLIWVVLLMFVGAILLARRRARAVMIVGIIFIVEALLLRLGMGFGDSQLSQVLAPTPFALASNVFFNQLTIYLKVAVQALFVVGVVLAFAGWAFGGSTSAIAAREWTSRNLAGAGERTGALAGVGRFVAPRRMLLRVLVLIVATVILLLADRITAGLVIWTFIGVLIALALIEFLGGAGRIPKAEPVAPADGDISADAVTETAEETVGSP